MVILEKNSDESIELICVATLISGDNILTSATCLSWVSKIDNILISKLKLPGEPYPDENIEYFPVKRSISHELYNNKTSSVYNVGLIQLEQPIPSTSFIRPACLLTNAFPASDKFETYGTVQHYGTRYTNFTTIPLTTLSNDACTIEFQDTSKDLANCLDHLNSFVCYDKNFASTGFFGSPIEVKVKNQNYIFGIILGCSSNCWGIKISHSIDWIESIVWQNQIKPETLLNPECGQRKVINKPLMTNSTPTYLGEFPCHVGIFKNRKYICGGTIISNRAVLTTAFCVYDERGVIPPNRFSIVAGTNSLNEYPIEAQNYIIERIIVHPNFNRLDVENDISILMLRPTIEFSNYIQPICLNNSLEYTSNMLGLVARWGRDEGNQVPDVLLQGTYLLETAHNNFNCRTIFNKFLNDNKYCAGYMKGTSVCAGDSGGGMIFEHESRWYLRGIVSLGPAIPALIPDQCYLMLLVLFTDIPKLYTWIITNVQDDV